MKIALVFTCAASALLMASGAFARPQSEGNCFWTRDLRNHTVADAHTIYFSLWRREVYRIQTSDNCLAGLSSTDPIVLRDRASTGQICTVNDVDITANGARCIISELTKLTPEQVAAIPRRVRP